MIDRPSKIRVQKVAVRPGEMRWSVSSPNLHGLYYRTWEQAIRDANTMACSRMRALQAHINDVRVRNGVSE